MTNLGGFWAADPTTGQDIFINYEDLEDDTIQSFIKPLGGFVFPANLFCLSKLPSTPFYIKNWIPKRGKSLLYAPAKAGKSYLCLQVARCIGSELDFLGLPTTKGKVLYIQFELGEEILQYRMKCETKQSYDNVFVGTTFSMKLDSKELGQNLLWRALEAVEPNVLILDPLYKAIIGDENEAHDILKILDFLDSVIEAFNCSIFITHHSGKDLSKRGRGSSVLEDWVDSYIQMQATNKAGEPLRVKIKPIFLRHAQLPPGPIEAVLGDDFEFHLVNAALSVEEQTAKFLREHRRALSPKELFDATIGSNTSVYHALSELVRQGKVSKEGRGKYKWVCQ